MTEGAPALLIVGWIQKPHGIRGELFVKLETDRPEAVFAPGRVLRLGDADGRPDGSTLTVERTRPFKHGLLLKPAGQGGRTPELEALRGRTVLVPIEEVPPAEDEVFYHDLIGLRVEAGGEAVGTVREVYELPSGVMLGVQRHGARELLIPFVREMVRRVDVEAGLVEIDAPPGLLEL